MIGVKLMMKHFSVGMLGVFLCVGCAGPTVRLDTPEPVKVDVDMRVDVYTHDANDEGSGDSANVDNKQAAAVRARMKNRKADVQRLKGKKIFGEARNGLLEIRNRPTDPSLRDYANRILREENEDRKLLFSTEAKMSDKPESEIASGYATRQRLSAFPGEWVQESDGSWVER